MKVFDLRCCHAHQFEGWFASEEAFQSQAQSGLVECPVCGDASVSKLPSAPRLNVSGAKAPLLEVTPAPVAQPEPVALQSLWMQAVQHVMAHTVDVGPQFAEEARRIHYGESEERAIRGQATQKESLALQEEGIDVVTLALPAAYKGPVQ